MTDVMSRPEGFAMHQMAKRVAPNALSDLKDHLSKAKRKVVAVEKHDADWRDVSLDTHDRFLWIKARDKITVKQIRDSYLGNCSDSIGVKFMLGKQEPAEDALMSSLDEYGDGFIVFTTQSQGDNARAAPLKPPQAPLFRSPMSTPYPPQPHGLPMRTTATAQTNGSAPMLDMNAPPNGTSDSYINGSARVFDSYAPQDVTAGAQSSSEPIFGMNAHTNGTAAAPSSNQVPQLGTNILPAMGVYAGRQSGPFSIASTPTPGFGNSGTMFEGLPPSALGDAARYATSRSGSISRYSDARHRNSASPRSIAPRSASRESEGLFGGSGSRIQSPRASVRSEQASSSGWKGGIHTMVKPELTTSHVGLSSFNAQAPPVKSEQSEPIPLSQGYEPRHIDNPFDDLPDDNIFERGLALQQLVNETDAERLEAAVKKGVKFLSEIEQLLDMMRHHDEAKNWLAQIDTVRKQAMRTRTVVGVVGNTGAGKSSVINAMLDEERLVPTNCMRACTAVVTELSYNDSRNPASKYRAEIEFIKPEDWRRELNVLHSEVFDKHTGAFNKEATNPDTDAGVAWAKIRAVYHKMNKDQLAATSLETLMQISTVRQVLGSTKRISHGDCDSFYKRLQYFVDSKDKIELDKNGNKKTNPKRQFEFWPLIKVVKVYTKADALSTGAVLVDLPGVHDSNAARAAVAESYMKQCTGLWIVAPINRAIDDKAAKNLLGDSFKRQLKFDGTYSCVTFICSKTDDISNTEATDSLQLGPRMSDLENRLSGIMQRRRTLKKKLDQLQTNRSDHEDAFEQIDESFDEWEELSTKVYAGKEVYAPQLKLKKRKRSSSSPQPRRNCNGEMEDDEPPAEADGVDRGNRLTRDEIDDKVEEFRKMRKESRRELSELKSEIQGVKDQLKTLAEQEEKISKEQDIMCIEGRNEYSRGAIQQDFAAGIKELDQEDAELEDANFNPEEDIRDYDEVARRLPVFCVSSRAFQKLSGRLKKDNAVAGFTLAEQTEMPQLQAHCKNLTENGRQAGCRRFLNALSQLLNSISLWASDDGTGLQMTSQQRNAEKTFLTHKLKSLEGTLEKVVGNTIDDIIENLDYQVFGEFSGAIRAASKSALLTAEGWGAHRSAGGLFWATYKAVVRRYGIFNSAAGGARDFNGDLVEPIYKHLASSWEKSFQRRLPHILKGFTKVASRTLKDFHEAVEKRCKEKGLGVARIGRLKQSLLAYGNIFSDLTGSMISGVNEAQREVNREFTPVIASAMTTAYEQCTAEAGSGSFKRMKEHMANHVSEKQVTMFEEACNKVQESLLGMCDDVRKNMLDRVDTVFLSMHRDYMTLIGVDMSKGHMMPREERAMRRDVDAVLTGSDAQFQEVVEGNLGELRDPSLEDDDGEAFLPRDDGWDGEQQNDDDFPGMSEDENEDEDEDEQTDAGDHDDLDGGYGGGQHGEDVHMHENGDSGSEDDELPCF